MGCERSRCEEPQPTLPTVATPQQEEAFAQAQLLSELLLDFQLQLEFAVVKSEDPNSLRGSMISINGPGAMRWFQFEKGTFERSRSKDSLGSKDSTSASKGSKGSPKSPEAVQGDSPSEKSLKDDFVVSTKEGLPRFQLVEQQRTSGSRVKHMLLRVDASGDSTLMYSIACPRPTPDNSTLAVIPLEIQAQSPGRELPQVGYLAGDTAHRFSLQQAGKLACSVARDGQRGSYRYCVMIEPCIDIILYVGLICAALNAHRMHHGD
jgi:hypothetical protein